MHHTFVQTICPRSLRIRQHGFALILQAIKVINVSILSAIFMIPISHVVPWMFKVTYKSISRRCIYKDVLFITAARLGCNRCVSARHAVRVDVSRCSYLHTHQMAPGGANYHVVHGAAKAGSESDVNTKQRLVHATILLSLYLG